MKWWNWFDPTFEIWISIECRTLSAAITARSNTLYSGRERKKWEGFNVFPFSFCVCCCVGPPFLRLKVPVYRQRPPLFSGRWESERERRQESFLPPLLSPPLLSLIFSLLHPAASLCVVCVVRRRISAEADDQHVHESWWGGYRERDNSLLCPSEKKRRSTITKKFNPANVFSLLHLSTHLSWWWNNIRTCKN